MSIGLDDNEDDQVEGFRNCTRNIMNTDGRSVEVNFDNIGIPSVIGMTLICAR
jgi:hypothetical protein